MPKVSVVITCYNYAHYLSEAVESIIKQTFKDWEIIIVNDGSTDNTKQIAENLIAKYSNYEISLINQINKGPCIARNVGVKQAKGKYILNLDSDDKVDPTFLEKTVRVLEANPQVAFVFTWIHQIGNVDRIIMQDPSWGLERLKKGICHIHSSTLFRKDVWEEIEGFNPNMKWGTEDLDFWISILKRGYQAKLIEEPLSYYRIHSDSLFQSCAIKHQDEIKQQIRLNHPELYQKG